MKITPEHYQHLKNAIRLSHTPERVAAHRAFIVKEGRAKDVDMRLRWDLAYSSPGLSAWISANIYPYANDDHLDTALRSIMREVFPA